MDSGNFTRFKYLNLEKRDRYRDELFIKSKPAKQRSQNRGRGHINYSPNLINISNHRCPVVESPLVPAVPLFDGLFLFLAHIMIFEFPLVTAGGEEKNCIVSNNFP